MPIVEIATVLIGLVRIAAPRGGATLAAQLLVARPQQHDRKPTRWKEFLPIRVLAVLGMSVLAAPAAKAQLLMGAATRGSPAFPGNWLRRNGRLRKNAPWSLKRG